MGDPSKAIESADCILIVTAHDEFQQIDVAQLAAKTSKPLVLVDG